MNSEVRQAVGLVLGTISLICLTSFLTLALILQSYIPLSISGIFALTGLVSAWLLWGDHIKFALTDPPGVWAFLFPTLRVSPEAVDIIIARACADPHLARTMGQTLKNAIRSQSPRNPQALDALDWFVPGSKTRSSWRIVKGKLTVDIEHADFRIAHARLYVRRALLPDTVITGIEQMPLADLVEIPILRPGNIVEAADIRMKPDAVMFDIFRDRRDIIEVIQVLEAIHTKNPRKA